MSQRLMQSILDSIDLDESFLSQVKVNGYDPILPSPFRIGEAGATALALVGYLALMLWLQKTSKLQSVTVNVADAALAQRSHQYLHVINGTTPDLWDPLSGFYLTKDKRHIQLHCNFPHHRNGVVKFLACANDKQSVAATILNNYTALELETALSERGLCAAMVRAAEEWAVHEQFLATKDLPLLEIIKVADSSVKSLPSGDMPLSGINVLDLTRVIAGPVAAKTLAEFGANVLNITSPNLPCILPLVMDTGFGKKNSYLDLDQQQDSSQLFNLIKDADVFIQSYRPGALAGRGFSVTELIKHCPGLIYVSLSAYSHVGPWAERHGYDSLVQSATGMVIEQSVTMDKLEHLPAQSLDYITGYLAALGVMESLRRRALYGGSYLVRVSLVQTANWLKSIGTIANFYECKLPKSDEIKHLLAQSQTDFGLLEHMLPVIKLSQTKPSYRYTTSPLGSDLAKWSIFD